MEKFYDPYSTFHLKTRQLNKFKKGVPFPYPCGGVWEKMLQQMNSEKDNPNQMPKNPKDHRGTDTHDGINEPQATKIVGA